MPAMTLTRDARAVLDSPGLFRERCRRECMQESDEQRTYREERTEELIWARSRALGMSRKRFLQFLASRAGATALGMGGRPDTARAQGHPPHFNQYANWFVKPTPAEYFIDHGHAKEMRWEIMKGRGYLQTFRARATDNLGQTQPDTGPKYNFHGYLYDGVVDHPVWVF
jgi:hypothetical protein